MKEETSLSQESDKYVATTLNSAALKKSKADITNSSTQFTQSPSDKPSSALSPFDVINISTDEVLVIPANDEVSLPNTTTLNSNATNCTVTKTGQSNSLTTPSPYERLEGVSASSEKQSGQCQISSTPGKIQ